MLTLAIPRRNPTALDQRVRFLAPTHQKRTRELGGGFFVYESLQRFQSQGEFAKSKRSLRAKTSALEPLQVFGRCAFRPVDDPEYSRPRTLTAGCAFPSLRHKLQRLYHHALAAANSVDED
jgi:hypothetical protein